MPIEFGLHRPGTALVRLLKVVRTGEAHAFSDWTVQVRLGAGTRNSGQAFDTSLPLASGTLEDTVYSLARSSSAGIMEEFAQELVDLLLTRNPHASSAEVTIASDLWKHLTIAGKPHRTALMHGSEERQTARVERRQDGSFLIEAGFNDMVLLETAHSSFVVDDSNGPAASPAAADGLLSISVRASWTYREPAVNFARERAAIREAMLASFAGSHSPALQHTLHAMGQAALRSTSSIDAIDLALSPRHAVLVDLSPSGQDNLHQVFVPAEEPHGPVEARVEREPA